MRANPADSRTRRRGVLGPDRSTSPRCPPRPRPVIAQRLVAHPRNHLPPNAASCKPRGRAPMPRWPSGKHQATCPTVGRRLHHPVRAGDNRFNTTLVTAAPPKSPLARSRRRIDGRSGAPYVVAMRSSTPSCSAVGDGPGQIDEPPMVESAPHGARALFSRSKNSE